MCFLLTVFHWGHCPSNWPELGILAPGSFVVHCSAGNSDAGVSPMLKWHMLVLQSLVVVVVWSGVFSQGFRCFLCLDEVGQVLMKKLFNN